MARPKLQDLGADLSAALIVSFLTIGAGSAFGLLTGIGAQAGVMSMIFASLVGWIFGGMPVKVSGPSGPTAAAMIAAVAALSVYGAPPSAVYVIMAISAVGLLFLGFFPVARVIAWVPNAVTAVFVNGVSMIIFISQLQKLWGFKELSDPTRMLEIGLALGTFVLLIYWPRISKLFESTTLGRLISGSLAAMIIAGGLTAIFDLPVTRLAFEPLRFDMLYALRLNGVTGVPLWALLLISAKLTLTIAFLTLAGTRTMGRPEYYKAELRNQATSNALMAVIGGIPASLGLIRMRILRRGGARTVFAGIMTALIVLFITVAFPKVLSFIPSSIFIGVLMRAATTGLDFQFLQDLRRKPDASFVTALIILIGSIAMIFFDHVSVIVIASLVWHGARRWGPTEQACDDLELCPLTHLPTKT